MKYEYDYAAEMIKIAESADHKKLFGLEKTAFTRDGQGEGLSEVEEEMMKLAHDDEECEKCEECGRGCDCDCHEEKECVASLEDMTGLLLEISSELEDQGQERLAAATIVLADNILKTAAAKKKTTKSKSKSKGKKKMTMKERMAKMRAMQGGKKKKTEEAKSSKEDETESESKTEESKSES